MSTNASTGPSEGEVSSGQMSTALFAGLVMQQSNMALMFLGRKPHPESGESMRDLDSARLFIDQLEMIESKTRGNLNKEEEHLLKEALTGLRMAFVEAVNDGTASDKAGVASSPEAGPQPSSVKPSASDPAAAGEPGEPEQRKKFSKKY
jgi:Domain of unknown function (DUF1844)